MALQHAEAKTLPMDWPAFNLGSVSGEMQRVGSFPWTLLNTFVLRVVGRKANLYDQSDERRRNYRYLRDEGIESPSLSTESNGRLRFPSSLLNSQISMRMGICATRIARCREIGTQATGGTSAMTIPYKWTTQNPGRDADGVRWALQAGTTRNRERLNRRETT